MEQRGQVNCYGLIPKVRGLTLKEIFTLNLNGGITPFVINLGNEKYQSQSYILNNKRIKIDYVFYRPLKKDFEKFNLETRIHVLNGGLLLGELGVDYLKDEVTDINHFQNLMKQVYGITLEEAREQQRVRNKRVR